MAVSEVPMRVFRAVVVRVEDLTPSLRRVVFGGPDLADFMSTGVGDEYLRVLFPQPGEPEPTLPIVVDGKLDYSSIDLDLLRTYTVRRHDVERVEVTIDFVVHEGGVASSWARGAEPGDVVGLSSPTGMYDPPPSLSWQVLVADCSGLPALARLLEQAPAGVRTRAVVEVPGSDHRLDLPGSAEVTWLYGGNGHGPSRLAEVVRSLPAPGGDGYVWVTGESKALRSVRKYLRKELGLPASSYKTVGYWIEDAELWNARYYALDDSVRKSLEAIWDSDRPEEEIEDEYEERLTALGL
jgi:NADPH-dependent ferric siderophore reductase